MNNTTEALANKLCVKPQSMRARLCRTGTYFGEKHITLVLPENLSRTD